MNNQLSHLNVLKIWHNDKNGNGIYLTDNYVVVVHGKGFLTDFITDYCTSKNDVPQWCADNNWTGDYKKTIDLAVLYLRNIKKVSDTLSCYDEDYKQYHYVDDPLWWHYKGLSQTSSGYGHKLTTTRKVFCNNRLYRLYCSCHSNVGVTYIIVNGTKKYLN